MSTLCKAAQQALEALDAGVSVSPKSVLHDRLRAALAQPEQEPVAWNSVGATSLEFETECSDGTRFLNVAEMPSHAVRWRIVAPPRREWRGLTMQEINALPEVGGRMWNMGVAEAVLQAIRAVEAALKERNNG